MDIWIGIGVLIIGLLAFVAMIALIVAIFRLIFRSGLLRAGVTDQEINRNFVRGFFVQDTLRNNRDLPIKSTVRRAIISLIVMLSMLLVVFLFVVPQLGINS